MKTHQSYQRPDARQAHLGPPQACTRQSWRTPQPGLPCRMGGATCPPLERPQTIPASAIRLTGWANGPFPEAAVLHPLFWRHLSQALLTSELPDREEEPPHREEDQAQALSQQRRWGHVRRMHHKRPGQVLDPIQPLHFPQMACLHTGSHCLKWKETALESLAVSTVFLSPTTLHTCQSELLPGVGRSMGLGERAGGRVGGRGSRQKQN